MWPKEGDPRLRAQHGGRAHPCKPHPRPTQGQWWGGAHVLPISQRKKSVSSSAFPEAGKLLDCTLCWVKFTLHFPCLLTMPVARRTRHQSSPNCKPGAGGPRVVADLLGPDLAPAASPLGLASFPLARLPPCHRLSRMESQGLKRLPTQAVVTPVKRKSLYTYFNGQLNASRENKHAMERTDTSYTSQNSCPNKCQQTPAASPDMLALFLASEQVSCRTSLS